MSQDYAGGVDPGARVAAAYALDPTTLTAGGTITTNGRVIDRLAAVLARGPGLLAVIQTKATLTDTKAVTITVHLEHGDESDLSDAADFEDWNGDDLAKSGTIMTADDPLLVFRQAFDLSADIRGLKRYCRIVVSAVFTASGTDTAIVAGTVQFTGLDESPGVNQVAVGAAT